MLKKLLKKKAVEVGCSLQKKTKASMGRELDHEVAVEEAFIAASPPRSGPSTLDGEAGARAGRLVPQQA